MTATSNDSRINAGADVGFLVTKRPGVGHTNAGRWWAHWRLTDLARLRGYPTTLTVDDAPVRMTLDSALAQLRAGGYGTPLETS